MKLFDAINVVSWICNECSNGCCIKCKNNIEHCYFVKNPFNDGYYSHHPRSLCDECIQNIIDVFFTKTNVK